MLLQRYIRSELHYFAIDRQTDKKWLLGRDREKHPIVFMLCLVVTVRQRDRKDIIVLSLF